MEHFLYYTTAIGASYRTLHKDVFVPPHATAMKQPKIEDNLEMLVPGMSNCRQAYHQHLLPTTVIVHLIWPPEQRCLDPGDFRRDVVKNFILPKHRAVSLGNLFPTFQIKELPSFSEVLTDIQRKGCRVISQKKRFLNAFNPLNPELNPFCYLLALLGAHHFLHVSMIRVKLLTFRLLMSYIYMEHPFLMFLDHTQRRSTVGRTPLDE